MMNILSKYYLISPKIDFILIGGIALFTYILFLYLKFPFGVDIAYWMLILAFFVNSPHFMISYQIFYSSAKGKILKDRRFLFAGIVVPIFIFLILCYGFLVNSKNAFIVILLLMFFLVGWHYIKQAYGCFILYSAGNKIYYNTIEQNLIKFSLYPLWIFSFFKLFTFSGVNNFWGLEYRVVNFLEPYVNILNLFSLIGIGIFLGLILYNILVMNKFPNITALTSILVIYIWLSPVFWNEIYFYMIPFFHSLQYFLFSGAYTKNKIKKDNAGIKGWLLWWGGAFILGALLFDFIPNALDSYFLWNENITPHLFLVSFILFINIHHYFIDNVIWKGSNPEVRNLLKFNSI